MKFFGSTKRSRVSRRNGVRSHVGGNNGLYSHQHQRDRLLRFLICLLGAIAILVGLQGWTFPFTHRIGERFADGLSAKMDFKVVDDFETKRAVAEHMREVPYVFVQDSQVLKQIPDQLRAALGHIAEAGNHRELSLEVQEAFGLQSEQHTPLELSNSDDNDSLTVEAGNDVEFYFQQLKQVITPLDVEQSETHISSIIDEFQRFLEPIFVTGVVDPAAIKYRKIAIDSTLAIVQKKDSQLPDENPLSNKNKWISVQLTEVTLSDLLNDAGLLGQQWGDYPTLVTIRHPLEHWLRQQVRPSLKFDQAATKNANSWARNEVQPVYNLISQGEELIAPDGVVDRNVLAILEAEYHASLEKFPWQARVARMIIVFVLISTLLALNMWFLAMNEPRVINNWTRLIIYLAVLVFASALGRVISFDPMRAEVAIVVATTMVMSVAYNQRMAIVTAFMLSLMISLATLMDIAQFTIMLASAATSVIVLKRVQSRSTIIYAGFLAAFSSLFVSWGMEILIYPSPSINHWWDMVLLQTCLKNAGWCLLAGFILAGSLPFIESIFGVVTGISLLEIGDPSHPLLQKLISRAPGTYNHSIAMATIAEAAAKKIGADGLLVRVGAYFHDVGKIPKAEYFIENRVAGAKNRHDSLAPAMSTLIIIGHVKDGVELATEHHLPQVLIDFIEQHHGTTLVEYFYHAANKKAEADPERKLDVEEAAFRYPGRKPQTREAGVLMLADCVESASRTLSEPTPARIKQLVHKLTMKRLLDGQFDECDLCLSEIHQIEESLIKSLTSMYHGRITYPEQNEQKTV
ncbi:MAG: HDIG domain-containing protein [Planctomycetaceae bacterium]|nr:HDIG domain-containing protein [Planctomycetaceae bacterium]